MGPLRRGLIATLAPTTAWAEVCDKVRPNWDGTPQTVLDHTIWMLAHPSGLLVLGVFALALVLRRWWGWLLSGLVGLFISLLLILDEIPTEMTYIHDLAQLEGCVGAPYLSLTLVAAITAVSFYRGLNGRKSQET